MSIDNRTSERVNYEAVRRVWESTTKLIPVGSKVIHTAEKGKIGTTVSGRYYDDQTDTHFQILLEGGGDALWEVQYVRLAPRKGTR